MKLTEWSNQKYIKTINESTCIPNEKAIPGAIEFKDTLYVVFNPKDQTHIDLVSYTYKNGICEWKDSKPCIGPNDSYFLIKKNSKPALCVKDGNIIMVWDGSGDDGLFMAFYNPETANWSMQYRLMVDYDNTKEQIRIRENTYPSITIANNLLFIAWVGYDNESMYFSLQLLESEINSGFKYYNQNAILFHRPIELKREGQFGRHKNSSIAISTVRSTTSNYDRILLAWSGVGHNDGIYYAFSDMFRNIEFLKNILSNKIVDTKYYEISNQIRAVNFGIMDETSPSLTNINGNIVMSWHGISLTDGFWYAILDNNEIDFSNQERIANIGGRYSPVITNFKNGCMLLWHGFEPDKSNKKIYYSCSEVKFEKALKGAVMIIGSLLWQNDYKENDNIRKDWREKHLQMNTKKAVKVPIRYGRLSGSADNKTYTMVFSKEYDKTNRLGNAYLFDIAAPIYNLEDMFIEMAALAEAEGIFKYNKEKIFTEWGFVTIIIKDKHEIKKEIQNTLLEIFKNDCPDTNIIEYQKSFGKLDQNDIIFFDNDNLNIKLDNFKFNNNQDVLNDYDFIIATVTAPKNPNVDRYPSPLEIAQKAKSDIRYYFQTNYKENIHTSTDGEIYDNLKN